LAVDAEHVDCAGEVIALQTAQSEDRPRVGQWLDARMRVRRARALEVRACLEEVPARVLSVAPQVREPRERDPPAATLAQLERVSSATAASGSPAETNEWHAAP
jgi:hypothetical protein